MSQTYEQILEEIERAEADWAQNTLCIQHQFPGLSRREHLKRRAVTLIKMSLLHPDLLEANADTVMALSKNILELTRDLPEPDVTVEDVDGATVISYDGTVYCTLTKLEGLQ